MNFKTLNIAKYRAKVLVHGMLLGPSVRARRDRQNLVKNKPQLDDEPNTDADKQAWDLEPSAESSPSHADAPVNSSTLRGRKRKRSDVSAAASHEVDQPRNAEGGPPLPPIVDETNDPSVKLPGSNLSSAASVANSEPHNHILTDACNTTVSKTLDPCVTVTPEDPKKCRSLSPAVLSEPLPKKSRSQVAEEKRASSSRVASAKDLSHHKTSQQLVTEGTISSHDLLGLDRHVTGNCVTLESMVDAEMHQPVRSDVILQPSVVKLKQIRVRFEGNCISFSCWLPLLF